MVRIPVVVLVDHRLVYRASSGGEEPQACVLCPLHRGVLQVFHHKESWSLPSHRWRSDELPSDYPAAGK